MSTIGGTDTPWFVATSPDEPDGWHFDPPPEVDAALRAVVAPQSDARGGPAPEFLERLSELWVGVLDDAALEELVGLIVEEIGAEADPGAPDLRGRRALLLAVAEEAHRAVLRRVRRTRRGDFRLRFGILDRALLGQALERLDDLLGSNDPSLARLFPNPYPDDPERAEGWRAMVTDELIEKRRAGLEEVREMLSRRSATEDEVLQLMRTVNDTRLMLGTHFDVSEDGPLRVPRDHPDALLAQAYDYLGYLLSTIIAALSGGDGPG